MAKKNKTIKDLNLEFEILAQRVKKLEEEKDSSAIDKIEGLEENIKMIDVKIHNLDRILKEAENKKDEPRKTTKCRDCEQDFIDKVTLTRHIKTNHPRIYNCKQCGESFAASWNLEKHMKSHDNVKLFKCNICEKDFVMKWRLEKHVNSHKEQTRWCHFFNNFKTCPFDDVGCIFKHQESPECKFDKHCNVKLCAYKHSVDEETVNKQQGSIDDDEKSLESKEKEPYENLEEYEKDKIREQICGKKLQARRP